MNRYNWSLNAMIITALKRKSLFRGAGALLQMTLALGTVVENLNN
ncbi:hypothetical protein ESCOMM100M1_21755 [Escherichia coli]